MSTELTEGGYEMVRCAVNVARQGQIRTLAVLRQRLMTLYPARAADINEGLQFWANSIARRHPNGPPNE